MLPMISVETVVVLGLITFTLLLIDVICDLAVKNKKIINKQKRGS